MPFLQRPEFKWACCADLIPYPASSLLIRCLRDRLKGRPLHSVTQEERNGAEEEGKRLSYAFQGCCRLKFCAVKRLLADPPSFESEEHKLGDSARGCFAYICMKEEEPKPKPTQRAPTHNAYTAPS